MGNFFEDIFNSDVHRLEDIRLGLDEALTSQIELVPLLKEHHDYLQESISILLSKTAEDSEKQAHLYRFFRLVEMHGKAEEEVLYPELRKSNKKEARLLAHASQDEHDVIFQLEAELLEMGYQQTWSEEIDAKGIVAASLLQNHIDQEESEIFPLSEELIPKLTFDSMRTSYINKCRNYFDESEMTSKEHPVIRVSPTEKNKSPSHSA